jgi:glutaredoxin 2
MAAKEKPLLRHQDMTAPYLVPSQTVDQLTSCQVYPRLFSLPQETDLLGLKERIRESYLLAHFAGEEHGRSLTQNQSEWLLVKKHFMLMTKLTAISIDGFKSERYIKKISDISETITRARKALLDEETQIQRGALPPEELDSALQRITGYLLKVETLITERCMLTEKLEKKQQKWNTSDCKFKERKATFLDFFKTAMAVLTQVCRNLETANTWGAVCAAHEQAVLMIDDVFIQNRLRAVLFVSDVEHQIQIRKESMNDLGQTQIELASKIQFIVEEQTDMRKQKDEMLHLQELKFRKEALDDEIQDQEQKIQKLKRTLGLQRNN